MENKFKVGERVTRTGKEQSDPRRRGSIERAYESMPNGQGQGVSLYAVRWDDTKQVEVGYMDINLEIE